jgi:hypothetical protein
MRRDLIAFVGGIFYVDVYIAVQIGRFPIVWFERDEEKRVLVNLDLPAVDGSPRLRMENNFWIETGTPLDLECPPSGTRIRALYANGDAISVRFREIASRADFIARYPSDRVLDERLSEIGADVKMIEIALERVAFPVAVVEIELKLLGGEINLNSR